MASLRNAERRPTHRERAQPRARKHLGLLEKHKDYVQRAKDYHKKEDRLRALRRKAAERNPDEFYFRMTQAKTHVRVPAVRPGRGVIVATHGAQGGVHVERKGKALDVEAVKELKKQDAGHLVARKLSTMRVRARGGAAARCSGHGRPAAPLSPLHPPFSAARCPPSARRSFRRSCTS